MKTAHMDEMSQLAWKASMTEQPDFAGGDEVPQDLKQRLDGIENKLLNEVGEDSRFSHGVGNTQADSDSDLDFIQMTGLTSPELVGSEVSYADNTPHETELPTEEMNPEAPVSFFEEGVGDVDSALSPVSIEDDPQGAQDLVRPEEDPSAGDLSSENSTADYLTSLKEIIDDVNDLESMTEAVPEASVESDAPATIREAIEVAEQEIDLEQDTGEVLTGVDEDISHLLSENSFEGLVAEADGVVEEVRTASTDAAALSELASDLAYLEETATDAEASVETPDVVPAVNEESEEEPVVDLMETSSDAESIENAPSSLQEDSVPPIDLESSEISNEEIGHAHPEEPEVVDCEEEDSTSAPAEIESEPSEADEDVPTVLPRSSAIPGELAEAETLLQALEAQERVSEDDDAQWGVVSPPVFEIDEVEERSVEELAQNAVEGGRRRRNGIKRRRNMSQRVIRWTIRLVVIAAVAVGGYVGYNFYAQSVATPADKFLAANRQMADGDYALASAAFVEFSRKHPMDVQAPDAEFLAAHALSLFPEAPYDRAVAAYEASEQMFAAFIIDRPDHSKRPRAETIRGTLLHQLGRHEEAIRILSDSRRRIEDADAELPSLRILARSYAALDRIEEAHSAYMRAAVLKQNLAPDEDYLELAALYRRLADAATERPLEVQYRELAVQQWDRVLSVQALPATTKRHIQNLIRRQEALLNVLAEQSAEAPTEATLETGGVGL